MTGVFDQAYPFNQVQPTYESVPLPIDISVPTLQDVEIPNTLGLGNIASINDQPNTLPLHSSAEPSLSNQIPTPPTEDMDTFLEILWPNWPSKLPPPDLLHHLFDSSLSPLAWHT